MAFINQVKTALLLGLLTALVLFVGGLFGTGGLLIAFVFVLIMNFGSYFYSDKIVLRMYKAQEVTDKSNRLYKMCKELSDSTGLPMPKVYIVPDKNANAFATGRNPQNAAVAATVGIMDLLNDRELKGVMAHEFAHIKNRDILISTIAGTIAGVISYLATMAQFAAIFGGNRDDNGGSNIAQLLILSIITPIIASIIQMAISRSREYLADHTGASFVKDGASLADALEKLEKDTRVHPMRLGNNATAHMMITNPFKGATFASLFSTHPSTKERMRRLRSMKF